MKVPMKLNASRVLDCLPNAAKHQQITLYKWFVEQEEESQSHSEALLHG